MPDHGKLAPALPGGRGQQRASGRLLQCYIISSVRNAAGRPGCRERDAGEIKQLKANEMQQGTSARRSGRNWDAVSGHRHGIAVLTAILILAPPFTAQGQTSGATGGPAN